MKRLTLIVLMALCAPKLTQVRSTSFKFDFGPGPVAPGFTQVLATTVYSAQLGYGFEPGAKVSCVEGIKLNKLGLVKYLAADALPFDPRRPDPLTRFDVPASPLMTNVKPLGN